MKSVLAIALALALISCGVSDQPDGSVAAPPKVVATTTFVADLVQIIGADDVELAGLMGPGIDPHSYKASAGDLRRMAQAEAIFFNGLHLEGKIADVLGEMGQRGVTTVAVTDCVPKEQLITAEGFSGVHDPHVWYDLRLWKHAAECVRDGLIELVPEKATDFESRAAAYLVELEALDAEVRQTLATIPEERRVLISAHDAFGYFGRAYNLEVRGLLGVSTASEASTADVSDLANFIVERKIPAIFVESSVPPRYVEALKEAVTAQGIDVTIGGSLYSDALGDQGSEAEDYIGTVRANVATIVAALGEPAPDAP